MNNLYFTGIYCYKEQYGQTYTYDKDGNVISSVDLAKTQSNFAYQGNQMTKLLNPSGSSYLYTYGGWENGTQKNLEYANSTDGQQYTFTYDAKGNVTGAKIEQNKPVTTIEAGKTYIIRNAYSGNTIDSGDQSGAYDNNTKNFRYVPQALYQKWEIEATENADEYRIKSPTFGLYLGPTSSEENAHFKISTPTSAQTFKILANGDGTFRILTNASNFTQCIDGQPGNSTNTDDQSDILQTLYTDGDSGQKWYFFPVIDTSDKKIETSAAYTENGNFLTSATDAGGNSTSYNYDALSGQFNNVTDPNGNTTNYSYKENSNTISSVRIGDASVQYEYDSMDRLEVIKQNGEQKYKITYDSLGRASQISVYKTNKFEPLMTTTYDLYGRPTVQKDSNNKYVETSYDALDNITEIKYNNDNNKRICYYYSTDNKLSKTIDYFEGTTTLYTYDLADRIVRIRTYNATDISETTKLKNELKYTYADKTNYLTGIQHYSEQLGTQDITYRYGDLAQGEMPDQIYSVSVNGVEKQTFVYDGLGRATNKKITTTSNIVLNDTFVYEDIVNTNKTTDKVKTITNAVGTYNYSYDSNGNIIKEQFNPVSTVKNRLPAYEKTFVYDVMGQLVRINDKQWDVTIVYTYDNRGNLLKQDVYDYTIGTLNPDNAYTTPYTYGGSWNDQLTNFGGASITYDNAGNPLNYKGSTMTWSEGSRLTQMIIPKGGAGSNWTIDFEYNANGQRTKKAFDFYGQSTTTTEYIYNGDKLAGQKSSDGKTLTFIYDHNGQYIGFNYNGAEYYYIKNMQGDVIAIANANGSIIGTYTYDAWGYIYAMHGTSSMPVYDDSDEIVAINPIRYRGYYYDKETGLYYLQSRYYDSETGRFINADRVLGANSDLAAYNLYPYCGNNPIIRYDDNGLFFKEIIRGIIHAGNAVAIYIGIDTAQIGAYFLNMEKDSEGIYHADFDCWQQYFGYNDLYDFVFDLGTSMGAAKFEFSYNNQSYIIWAWKGDYINLGAGAELGIYYGEQYGHWLVDKNLAMPMTMYLFYEGKNIISYSETTWWITGFNPAFQNKKSENLTAIYYIQFTDNGLYNAFRAVYDGDPRLVFYKLNGLNTVMFTF